MRFSTAGCRAHSAQYTLFLLCSVTLSQPVFASYSDGFYTMIIVFFSMPIAIFGLVLSLVWCGQKKFTNNAALLTKYCCVWGVAALLGSALCLAEFHYGLAAFAVLLAVILILPVAQYLLSKKRLTQSPKEREADQE